jgi:CheY-like chemotaxis protein
MGRTPNSASADFRSQIDTCEAKTLLITETNSIKNILLVEDDPIEVGLTLAALEPNRLANKVAIVDTGMEALDYLYRRGRFETRAGGNPILMLLDLKLPDANGLEVLEIIKADEYLRTIPVVMLSSLRETPVSAGKYGNHVNAYVPKPIDFAALMTAVEQLGSFWEDVDEPPPFRGNAGSSTLIDDKGRTPNSHGKNSTLQST